MNEKEIKKIADQEQKIVLTKWYLEASFFPLIILVIWVYIKALMTPAANPIFDMKHDQMVATKILITFSLFAVALIIGYFYNLKLSKKLDRLWEQKKALLF